MPLYHLLNQAQLIELAAKQGWLEGVSALSRRFEDIPPIDYFSSGRRGTLPEARLETLSRMRMRIPTAIIHGQNFSLIIEDKIFPGGFAHSFGTSAAWKPTAGGQFYYRPKGMRRVEAKSPCLLGMTSHWGHFFVDALDRLFQLEELKRLDAPLLIGDPDFLDLRPQVDDRHSVPQVSELMRLLGVRLDPGNVIPILKQFDYEASDITVCTLESIKPAISSGSFRMLRQRLLGEVGQVLDDSREFIFVGRSDIKKRFILNQQALMGYLERVHKAETVFPEHLTVEQAIRTFSSASRIIIPIGSAIFNLAFCRPGTKVVCITPRDYAAQNAGVALMTRHLCHALGLKLAYYEVEIREKHPLINSDMIISEADIGNIVDVFENMA